MAPTASAAASAPSASVAASAPSASAWLDVEGDGNRLLMLDEPRTNVPSPDLVVALEFSRSPQWFLDCFVCGEALDMHRSAMLAVGRPCTFGGEGARLIVSPEVVSDVLLHLSSVGVTFESDLHLAWDELRARHVIVSESLEAEVMEVIKASKGSGRDGGKGKDHVRVKRRVVIDVHPGAWHEEVDKGFDTTKWLYPWSL